MADKEHELDFSFLGIVVPACLRITRATFLHPACEEPLLQRISLGEAVDGVILRFGFRIEQSNGITCQRLVTAPVTVIRTRFAPLLRSTDFQSLNHSCLIHCHFPFMINLGKALNRAYKVSLVDSIKVSLLDDFPQHGSQLLRHLIHLSEGDFLFEKHLRQNESTLLAAGLVSLGFILGLIDDTAETGIDMVTENVLGHHFGIKVHNHFPFCNSFRFRLWNDSFSLVWNGTFTDKSLRTACYSVVLYHFA